MKTIFACGKRKTSRLAVRASEKMRMAVVVSMKVRFDHDNPHQPKKSRSSKKQQEKMWKPNENGSCACLVPCGSPRGSEPAC